MQGAPIYDPTQAVKDAGQKAAQDISGSLDRLTQRRLKRNEEVRAKKDRILAVKGEMSAIAGDYAREEADSLLAEINDTFYKQVGKTGMYEVDMSQMDFVDGKIEELKNLAINSDKIGEAWESFEANIEANKKYINPQVAAEQKEEVMRTLLSKEYIGSAPPEFIMSQLDEKLKSMFNVTDYVLDNVEIGENTIKTKGQFGASTETTSPHFMVWNEQEGVFVPNEKTIELEDGSTTTVFDDAVDGMLASAGYEPEDFPPEDRDELETELITRLSMQRSTTAVDQSKVKDSKLKDARVEEAKARAKYWENKSLGGSTKEDYSKYYREVTDAALDVSDPETSKDAQLAIEGTQGAEVNFFSTKKEFDSIVQSRVLNGKDIPPPTSFSNDMENALDRYVVVGDKIYKATSKEAKEAIVNHLNSKGNLTQGGQGMKNTANNIKNKSSNTPAVGSTDDLPD